MHIISKEDIQKIFSMQNAIESCKEALRLYSSGSANVPLRTILPVQKHHGQSLFMPAYVENLNALGIKIVSVYPKNIEIGKPAVPAQMILLNAKTGEVSAFMDGTYLTQLRTGAVQGAATDLLARKDAKIGLLIGAGGQAETQLEAMLTVRNLNEVRIYSRHFEQAKLFAWAMQKKFESLHTKIHAVKNVNESVREADIITAITNSKTPVFDGYLVRKGTHINGMGSYTHDMQEIPESLLLNADKIIFDTTDGVLSEAGDILIPMKAGHIQQSDFNGELGQLILNQIKGREHPGEITFFKSVGSAVLDVVTAHFIYMKVIHNEEQIVRCP